MDATRWLSIIHTAMGRQIELDVNGVIHQNDSLGKDEKHNKSQFPLN